MRLLITGAWGDGKNSIAMLEEKGHSVVFMQYEKDALPCPYEWVEGVVQGRYKFPFPEKK